MKKNLILLFSSTLFIILFLEIVLRFMGHQPGVVYSKWSKKVDKLESLKGFTADADGIFKVDTQYLPLFKQQNITIHKYTDSLFKEQYVQEIFGIIDHYHTESLKTLNNNFTNKVNSLNNNIENDLDSAIINFIHSPINNEGFHSIAFKKHKSKKIKVLLLGDSFTWGHSAINKTNSFANELLAKDYIVYNTGISGADVTQYKAIAEKYIPILKPDIVILNFFMGNDINYYRREIEPVIPIFYATNAGNLMSFQIGEQLYSKEEAYENSLKFLKIKPDSWSRKFAANSTIGTLAWTIWKDMGKTSNGIKVKEKLLKPPCNQEIEDIISICEQNGSQFELVAIPDFLYHKTHVEDFPYLFENIDYKMSPVLKVGYKMSDGHFNDNGHKEYAEFLDRLIHQTFSKSDSIN